MRLQVLEQSLLEVGCEPVSWSWLSRTLLSCFVTNTATAVFYFFYQVANNQQLLQLLTHQLTPNSHQEDVVHLI